MAATVAKYSQVAIVLHWVIAVLIIANIALGFVAENVPEAYIRLAFDTHKSIGITVVGLALMRILWRAGHRPPPLPASFKPWEQRASHSAHGILYLLMFIVPITGWLHDSAWKAAPEIPLKIFGLFEFPRLGLIMDTDAGTKEMLHGLFGEIHELLAFALIGLVALHILGALKHQFIDREKELQRIWF